MYELWKEMLIMFYLAVCAYILVKSCSGSISAFDSSVLEDKVNMNLFICMSYMFVGQLAVATASAFDNVLLLNSIHKDTLDIATNILNFILTSVALFRMMLYIFADWEDMQAMEIFKRLLLKIILPLFISGIFSRSCLNIMKNLCNTQILLYREILEDEKVITFWCLAIGFLLMVCNAFRGVTASYQNMKDIDKFSSEENNEKYSYRP